MRQRRPIRSKDSINYTALRGNDDRKLFTCNDDYDALAALVSATARDLQARVLAFCWMPQELHFLLHTPDSAVLTCLMHHVGGMHARHINSRLGKRGHLFAGRYRSVPIRTDHELAEVMRYMHLKPVRIGLASSAADYPWTSHLAYLNRAKSWISSEKIRSIFSDSGVRWRARYRRFIESAPDAVMHTRSREILCRLEPRRPAACDYALLAHIATLVAVEFGVPVKDLAGASRRGDLATARALVAWYAVHSKAATLTAAAAYCGRKPCTLSLTVRSRLDSTGYRFKTGRKVFLAQVVTLMDRTLPADLGSA